MKPSEKIIYKGKTYYIDSNADKSNTKLFLYLDPELKLVAKSGSGTLMVKRADINDKLKETMKKSELKQIIREEIKGIISESKFKVGDIVKPSVGPHKGWKHRIIHDFGNGKYNIQPIGLKPSQIKYRLGAAGAKEQDLELSESTIKEGYSKDEIENAMARYKGNVGLTSRYPTKFVVIIDGIQSFWRVDKADCQKGIEKLKKYLPGAKFEIKPK